MVKNTRKVGLEGIKFNSPIGYFSEERIIRNDFLVDIYVVFEANNKTEDINQTVDYTQLYNICEEFFNRQMLLVETVGQLILDEVKQRLPFVDEIYIKIRKYNPSVKGQIANSFIELTHKK